MTATRRRCTTSPSTLWRRHPQPAFERGRCRGASSLQMPAAPDPGEVDTIMFAFRSSSRAPAPPGSPHYIGLATRRVAFCWYGLMLYSCSDGKGNVTSRAVHNPALTLAEAHSHPRRCMHSVRRTTSRDCACPCPPHGSIQLGAYTRSVSYLPRRNVYAIAAAAFMLGVLAGATSGRCRPR